jgi:repressor of nif and glnA expression
MRPVYGMKEADRPILHFLHETGLALRATDIIYNLDTRRNVEIPESTFYRRVKRLQHAGLVEKEDDSYYAITELGERLLDEDLSDDELSEVSQRLQEDLD